MPQTRRFALQIGVRLIEYDRDYGIDGRSGWTAVVGGAASSPNSRRCHGRCGRFFSGGRGTENE